MKTVVLRPGHCACDPGAVYGGFIERDLNLKVSLYAKEALVKKYEELNVVLARKSNSECLHIADTIKLAEKLNADLIVDVEHNAGRGRGSEVLYNPYTPGSMEFAEILLAEFVAAGRPSRGIKNGKNYRILNTKIPAGLGEYAFLDNPKDNVVIDTDEELRDEGELYAAAIAKYLKLKPKPIDPPKPPEKPAPIKAGSKITLSNVPLFASASAEKAARKVSGIYFVYDAKNFNGRYRITISADRCGKLPTWQNVTGYVNAADLTPTAIQPEPIKQGRKLALKDTPLYASSTSAKPTGRITGTYYLYDGVKYGNRYRITVSEAMCGKKPVANNVTGYISAEDVK